MASKPEASHHVPVIHFRTLFNKQGRLNIHGTRNQQNPFSDLYHYFLSLTWPKFLIHIATIYFLTNLLFGVLYFICGVHASILQCFFLSIENMSSVDYSRMGARWPGPVYPDDHPGLLGIIDTGRHYRFILRQVFPGHGTGHF